uniref:Non-structural replication polyprotein n=1 Tax=Culex pseudovishnui tymo-like virus TaxID=2682816 RepID=A0A6F8PYU7_9VIRU|nr:RNA-dependent RNA polymerase [Culex pseudovishnui tymo-like virus]
MFGTLSTTLASTVHRDAITHPLAERAVPAHRDALERYPYNLSDWGLRYAMHHGIMVPGTGFTAHPHPVHKTFEKYLLHEYWSCLARTPSTVMYMKRQKFERLRAQNPNFTHLFNQIHTNRDEQRYECTNNGPITTELAFMHDALMYVSMSSILDLFERSPRLQTLYASLVIPAESSIHASSMTPDLYRYSIRGTELIYQLEGSEDGAYTQPLKALDWLKCHEIVGPRFSLSVSLCSTKGPFHVLQIARTEASKEYRRFYTPSSYVLPVDTAKNIEPVGNRLVPSQVYESLFTYVRAVRTLRVTDVAGYVRTQQTKPEYNWVSPAAWDRLNQFVLQTSHYRPNHVFRLFSSLWDQLLCWLEPRAYIAQSGACLLTGSLLGAAFKWSDKNRISLFRLRSHNFVNDSINPFTMYWRKMPRWITGQAANLIKTEKKFEPIDWMKQQIPSAIIKRFPQYAPRTHWKHYAAATAVGLGFAAAIWYATRDYTQNCKVTQYYNYMHPKRFYLEWETESFNVPEHEPFFLLPFLETESGPRPDVLPPLAVQPTPSQPGTATSSSQADEDDDQPPSWLTRTLESLSPFALDRSRRATQATNTTPAEDLEMQELGEEQTQAPSAQANAPTAVAHPNLSPQPIGGSPTANTIQSPQTVDNAAAHAISTANGPPAANNSGSAPPQQLPSSGTNSAVPSSTIDFLAAADRQEIEITRAQPDLVQPTASAPVSPDNFRRYLVPFFDRVRALPSQQTDEFRNLRYRQTLKLFSLLTFIAFNPAHSPRILELGAGPGTWTRALYRITHGHRQELVAVTPSNGFPFDNILVRAAAQDETLTLVDSTFERYLSETHAPYQLVISDVAQEDTYLDNGTQRRLINLILGSRGPVFTPGATFICKVSNCFLDDLPPMLDRLRSSFRRVSLLKPRGSRLRSTEAYIVAQGFGTSGSGPDPPNNQPTIIDAIFTRCQQLLAGESPEDTEAGRAFDAFVQRYAAPTETTPASTLGNPPSAPSPIPPRPPTTPATLTPAAADESGDFQPAHFDQQAVNPAPPTDDMVAESLLAADPTAVGPVVLARALYNMSEVGGLWNTRRRRADAPIPPIISGRCLLTALSRSLSVSVQVLWERLAMNLPDSQLRGPAELRMGLTFDHLEVLASLFNFRAIVNLVDHNTFTGPPTANREVYLSYRPGHWEYLAERPPGPLHSPLSEEAMRGADSSPNHLYRFLKQHTDIPTRAVHCYPLHLHRAKNLMSNMKNHLEGAMFRTTDRPNTSPDHLHMLSAVVDSCGPRSVDLSVVLGFPGCGKSYPIMQALKVRKKRDFMVIVPTVNLRNEWLTALQLPSNENWRVSTWEVALTRTVDFVIIDEIFKLPNGYLDLLIALNPNLHSALVLGDPLQGDYHSVNEDSTNRFITSELYHLQPFFTSYIAYTRRLDNYTAGCLGVRTYSNRFYAATRGQRLNSKKTTLVTQRAIASNMNMNGIPSYTAAGSQGLTVNDRVTIVIDKSWNRCSPQISFVACTRSRSGVHFAGLQPGEYPLAAGAHPAFEALLTGKTIDYVRHFQDLLGNSIIIRTEKQMKKLGHHHIVRRGAGDHFRSLNNRYHRMTQFKFDPYHPRAIRDPYGPQVKSTYTGDVLLDYNVPCLDTQIIPSLDTNHLPETRRPLHYDINCAAPEPLSISEVELPSAPIEPVYPGYNYEVLIPELTREEDPQDLEIWHKGERSNQFPFLNLEFRIGAQTFSILAPFHNSKKDHTLLSASIEKRLRFRTSDAPTIPTARDHHAAQLLYMSYCEALDIDPDATVPFDSELFLDCILENEFAQLSSKSQAVIMANAERSDPDWRYSYVRIFSKTQHKINNDSLFTGWKACQTLALFHDYLVLVFGPVKKYQRAILERQGKNKNVFIYAGHSPFDLSAYVRANFPPNTHRAWNDFSAFDQSQGVETTLFEVKKMERVCIPAPLVEEHLRIKTRLTCQFGPLTSMRFTGEPGTYDDNTDYNIAITNLRYFIRETPCLFSGDDSAMAKRLPERDTWKANSEFFSNLRFKAESGQYATFCGYYIGSEGAVRCPKPLITKLMLALDEDALDDKLASYVTEFSVGHSLGDEMWNLLPLDQVPYQSAAFDFICRHAPRELKVALNIGSVPADVLSTWTGTITRPLFALLSKAQRLAYLKSFPSRFASWAHSFLPSREGL